MYSIRIIRWLMVTVSAALALFLIARGNVVVGVILAILTALRVALLVRVQQRRALMRERFRARRQARVAMFQSRGRAAGM